MNCGQSDDRRDNNNDDEEDNHQHYCHRRLQVVEVRGKPGGSEGEGTAGWASVVAFCSPTGHTWILSKTMLI
ncbi:hypothetical protein C0Q70_02628 [Pomacea canaliculata]|uniref:Uncharacterized protein n=1 Tax=Pomacea canaliculata TaxID=400727 RepID=A0A2T7PQH3_POMCA|nr:hypothetical protein C0Q70_02628 [Pomacea canaliculata]